MQRKESSKIFQAIFLQFFIFVSINIVHVYGIWCEWVWINNMIFIAQGIVILYFDLLRDGEKYFILW